MSLSRPISRDHREEYFLDQGSTLRADVLEQIGTNGWFPETEDYSVGPLNPDVVC